MGWFDWKRWTRKDLTNPAPVASGYRENANRSSYLYHYEERPPFSIVAAEMMQFDPKVTIGLAVRNGILSNAEVNVEDGPPAIRQFVADIWAMIWRGGAQKIIETKNYGFSGFEVMYREEGIGRKYSGKIVFDSLKDFHPRDVRPLVDRGRVVGMTVRNCRSLSVGRVPIPAPKSLWLTYGDRYNSFYGYSLLEHAYPPWYEKWMRGGAIKLRQLRMVKDAWIGDRLRYPANRKTILPTGEEVSYRDVANEIGAMRQSGGVICLPSDVHGTSNQRLWDYEPPTAIDGASQVFEYTGELDAEILEGLEVPSEVLEAAEGGSLGNGGRSIPFVALLMAIQDEFDDYVRQVDQQIIKPLVRVNFNVEPCYNLIPKSLLETVGKILGGGSQEDASAGAKPQQQQQPMQQRPAQPGMNRAGIPGMGGNRPQLQMSMAGLFNRYGDFQHNREEFLPAHVRVNNAQTVTGNFGVTVGGVYYPPGSTVSAEAIVYATPEERLQLSMTDKEGHDHSDSDGRFVSKGAGGAKKAKPASRRRK